MNYHCYERFSDAVEKLAHIDAGMRERLMEAYRVDLMYAYQEATKEGSFPEDLLPEFKAIYNALTDGGGASVQDTVYGMEDLEVKEWINRIVHLFVKYACQYQLAMEGPTG